MKQNDSSGRDTRSLQYDNDFWRFSLAVYAQPDVADECLNLQQAAGIDVNLLLFSAWTGTRSIVLNNEDIEAASQQVAAWQDLVIRPLRSVRQKLKTFEYGGPDDFRARVKAAEIEAEQIEQAILFSYSNSLRSAPTSGRDAVSANVKKYIDMKSGAGGTGTFAPRLVEAALRRCS